MKKEDYVSPNLEIYLYLLQDIITSSGDPNDDGSPQDETEFIPS